MRRLRHPRRPPIPPRCCRPMPFWGTMPEPTRYRPPWACCPCLAKAVSGARAARSWLSGGRPGHCAGTARLYRAVPAGAALFGHGAGAGQQRCASYHIWAALPLTPTPDGEELRPQYLASGLTLRAVVPLDSQQLLVFAAHTPVGRGSTVRRVHLQDPALPRLLERGGAVADFGWDKQGLVLSVRRME